MFKFIGEVLKVPVKLAETVVVTVKTGLDIMIAEETDLKGDIEEIWSE